MLVEGQLYAFSTNRKFHVCCNTGVEQAMGQGGRMPPDFDAMGRDWTLPPLSDGVTVYGATEIRGPTNLSAG